MAGRPWGFIRKRNIFFAAKYATFIIFFAIFTLEWLTGGIRSPAIYWVCAIPVIAIFFNGLEQGLKWSVLVVAGGCLFAFLDIKGYPVPNFVPEDKEAIVRILSPSSLFVAIFIMSIFYELNTRRAILKFMEKQRELITSERRFKDVATSMADFIWEIDAGGVVTYCSEGIKHTLGFEPQELIGNSPAVLRSPDEVARLAGEGMGPFKAREPFENIKRTYIHKDGREVRLLSSGVPVFDEDGRFCGYRGVDRDITEQEQMEDALRKSEERLRDLFIMAPIGIYRSTIGPKGKFLIVNPAMAKIFGYQRQEELLDIHVSDLYQDPEERKVFSDTIVLLSMVI